MKKRRIILATMLSMVAVGGITTYEIVKNNTNEEITVAEKLDLEESDRASDDLFGGNSEIYNVGKISLTTSTEEELTAPEVGIQYAYSGGYLSIRFFAVVNTKNINAVWTRTLYDKDGKVATIFPKGTYVSTTAYSNLSYYDDKNEVVTVPASDYGGQYFIVYTIKNIPSQYFDNYYFDARIEISNDNYSATSKTCDVKLTDAPVASCDVLSVNNTVAEGTSAAGNGTYINKKAKTIYQTEDSFDGSNIILNVGGLIYNSPTVTGFDSTSAGTKKLTLDYGRVSAPFEVYVLDDTDGLPYVDSNTNYVVTVDPVYNGVIGSKDGTNGNMFTTISQALEYLQNTEIVPYSANKVLNIKAGYYKEKLEITTPNLTINGAGVDSTKIEWDSLYGIVDYNGFKHTTDSTMTVAVRDTATNCKINDITISNKYNNIDAFNDTKAPSYTENNKTVVYAGNGERALALLVQADQFVMEDSKLLGWQDTLELFTGRQYFKNTYISGCIDYIFGTNSTTLFDSCEIHTVEGKANASSDKVNAYITASKGLNKNSSDAVNYGFIFNNCNFTSDSDFVGTYAIARPWTVYSSVAILNSTFDNKLATDESKTISNGLLGGATQDVDTLKIKFYNNGKTLTNDLTYVDTSLTSTTAANYTDYSVIYGKSNGGVSYALAWHPVNGLETDANTYYYFNSQSSSTGTSNTYDGTTYEGKSGSLGNMTIDATNGKLANNGGQSAQFNAGTKLIFPVAAKSIVTVTSHPGNYYQYKITGSVDTTEKFANAVTSTYYFETAQTVTITSIGGAYIASVVVSPNQGNPDYNVSSINIVGAVTQSEVGDKIDTNFEVYASYTGNYKTKLSSSDYTVSVKDPSADDFTVSNTLTTAGTYIVRVTMNGESVYDEYNVVVAAATDYIQTNTIITFGENGNYGSNAKIEVTQKSDHGNDETYIAGTVTFAVKAGAKIFIHGHPGYTNYTISAGTQSSSGTVTSTYYSYIVTNDSTVTITCGSNNYLYEIDILYPIITDYSITIGTDNTGLSSALVAAGGTVKDGLSGKYFIYDGILFDATSGKIRLNGGDNAQINTGTKIVFTVAAGATVTVTGYDGMSDYSLTGSDANNQEQVKTVTYSVATEVEVIATGSQYIKTIAITYPSA